MNIIISGFTGSGKTTIAQRLSKRLNMEFIDIDRYIEKKNKLSINQIYDLYSQTGFNKLERAAVKEVSMMDNVVIATGGSTILRQKNVDSLKKNGAIVFLDVTVDTIFKRVMNADNSHNDKEDAISQLLMGRLPIYKAAADICINADDDDIEKKVDQIIEQLEGKM